MKSTKSEMKPIKIGKRPKTTYFFVCKYFTHNFKAKRSKNGKQSTHKSHCVVCRSNKSRFKKKTTTTKDNLTLY